MSLVQSLGEFPEDMLCNDFEGNIQIGRIPYFRSIELFSFKQAF